MARIRVALLGTGGIARKHVPSFTGCDDAEIVAGCDVSKPVVEAFWQRALGDAVAHPPSFDDAEEMYAKAQPNAVVICTPHTLHFEQGMRALKAGCHVLMEKPMVTSAEHAYQIADQVAATGRVFCIAYNTPCSPEFAYLRELIRHQTLGRLEMVNGYLSQGWLKGTAGSWRQDPALSGGGQAYDSGAHPLCSLTWSVESEVDEVFAYVDNCGAPVDINSVFNVKFTNGVMASMAISGNCPSNGSHMVFIFDGGRVEVDPWGASWINVFQGRERVKYPPITGKPTSPADNFLDAILGRDKPRTSPANGIVHSQLMDAIYESARTGRPAKATRRT